MVVVIMPLSMWPIILSSVGVVWSSWFIALSNRRYAAPSLRFYNLIFSIGVPIIDDTVTSTAVITGTVAILALNAAFPSYICNAAATDKVRGNNVLPVYPGDPSLSEPELPKNWYLWGHQRIPTDRAVMVSHCAGYILRNSKFLKHA